MVHSERILKYELINSSTAIFYMKKVSHYVEAIYIFLKMCILMKVDLIPFWFPLVNRDLCGFNFFYLHKRNVFDADFEVNNTCFYYWKVIWNIGLTIPIFIYV